MGWIRQVLNQRSWEMVTSLPVHDMDALEISGRRWQTAGFRTYRSAFIDELDIDRAPLDHHFDIILVEQVWEHLKYPYRAGRHAMTMLKPGGYLYLSVPFLVRRHDDPIDCTRWTDVGLRYYFEEIGFPVDTIRTESWGNIACAIANLSQWTEYDPSHNACHVLDNDPSFPVQTWGLAQRGP